MPVECKIRHIFVFEDEVPPPSSPLVLLVVPTEGTLTPNKTLLLHLLRKYWERIHTLITPETIRPGYILPLNQSKITVMLWILNIFLGNCHETACPIFILISAPRGDAAIPSERSPPTKVKPNQMQQIAEAAAVETTINLVSCAVIWSIQGSSCFTFRSLLFPVLFPPFISPLHSPLKVNYL